MPASTRGLGGGECLQKAVQQQLHAEIIAGAAEEHRRALAGEHGRIVEQLARVFEHFEFLDGFLEGRVVQLAAHRRVVHAADGNRCAKLAAHRALEKMHLARLAVEHAAKIEPVADGPVHRKRADAQHPLQFVHEFERIFHGPVALVHEREDRHAALAADLEELARLRLDALRGVNHHHHRVHRREHAIGVLGKILVAGRVQQIDAVAVVVKLQHGGADGNAALFFQFHPVARRRALVFARRHRAGQLHRPAVQQELLRQRGFTRVRMRDDGERAPPGDFFGNAHKASRIAEI